MSTRDPARSGLGDFQTPPELADQFVASLDPGWAPAAIVDPTCGRGSLLAAAARRWPAASLWGYELSNAHLEAARQTLGVQARLAEADAFRMDWTAACASWPRPVLVLANPPWVTRAALTRLGVDNAPAAARPPELGNLDSRTGKGNFDLSEWLLRRLVEELHAEPAHLAALVKAVVGRRVLAGCWRAGLSIAVARTRSIDARRHFSARVDAVALEFELGRRGAPRCEVFRSLEADQAERHLALRGDDLAADERAYDRVEGLLGDAKPPWRSGIKHDCTAVMELELDREARWRNGLGEVVDLEREALFPLLKARDLARGERRPRRLILPQRRVAEDPARLAALAPRTWAYLERHGDRLDARRSTVYLGRPRFAVFGVGEYSFAPWKVCVSGLHWPPRFTLAAPVGGRPVMLDDTSYFLGFEAATEARRAHEALCGERAADILRALVFPDAKRPITKAALQRLDWRALEGT